MAKNKNISDTSFDLFSGLIDNLKNTLQSVSKEIAIYVQQQRALGVSDEQIKRQLLSDLENKEGFFSALAGRVEGNTDSGLNMLAQFVSNLGIVGKKKQLYRWKLDPRVQKHCKDCLENSELGAHDIGFWRDRGIPGAGTTQCKRYCHCTLEPVKDTEDKK